MNMPHFLKLLLALPLSFIFWHRIDKDDEEEQEIWRMDENYSRKDIGYDYWDDYKNWLRQLKVGDKHKGGR